MIQLSDIDKSLVELNAAIAEHYSWAGKLLELGLLGGEPDDAMTHDDAHEKCRFSKWFTQFDARPSRHSNLINDIFDAHRAMHQKARELLISIMNKSVTHSLLRNYHLSQQHFIHSIDQYKHALITFRNLHDTLTGLPLRHLLYLDFEEIRRRPETRASLWLVVMDIDRFKNINDTRGHNAGDDVLRAVAATLRAGTRHWERIYRFGGEEFVILLDCRDEQEATVAAERIRQHLEQHPVTLNEDVITVTVTGGFTRVDEKDTLHDAIGRADKALYYGKNHGRNCCVLADHDGGMTKVSY